MSDATAPPPAVEAADVHKHYDRGRVRAVDGASLRVQRGELVALTGPSGSGKSTLLHLLAALDTPTSGSISVDGCDLRHLPSIDRYQRHEVGLVFQLHNLLPQLDARQNVEIAMFGTHRSRVQRRARAEELLADEPTGSLDTAAVSQTLDLLRRLRAERGVTIVMVTHDPSIAAAADRLVTMRDGRIEGWGVPAGAYRRACRGPPAP